MPGGLTERLKEVRERLGMDRSKVSDDEYRQLVEEEKRLAQQETSEFRGGHWEEPNVFSHVRVNDRVGPSGEKILFIEELQSDWALEGRRKGFDSPEQKAAAEKQLAELEGPLAEIEEAKNQISNTNPELIELRSRIKDLDQRMEMAQKLGHDAAQIRGYQNRINYLMEEAGDLKRRLFKDLNSKRDELLNNQRELQEQLRGGVPPFPFSRNWHEVALKRMLRYAAENGYDQIAWTTGEQQVARYNLKNYIDSLMYKKNADGTYNLSAIAADQTDTQEIARAIPVSKLEDYVGKEIAKKIVEDKGGVYVPEDVRDDYSEHLYLATFGDGYGVFERGAPGFPDGLLEEYSTMAEAEAGIDRLLGKDIDLKLADTRVLHGVDLEIGGEWAYNLYDRMVPAFLNKYGKQWGARVGETTIGSKPLSGVAENLRAALDQHGFASDVSFEQFKRLTGYENAPSWMTSTMWEALKRGENIVSGSVRDYFDIVDLGKGRQAVVSRLRPNELPEEVFDTRAEAEEYISNLGKEKFEDWVQNFDLGHLTDTDHARLVEQFRAEHPWERLEKEKVHRLSLTPTMKRAAVEEGQYMFSGSPDTSEWFKDVWNAVKESRTARGSSIEWTTLGDKLSNLWEKLRVPVGDWGDYQKLSNKYLGELQIAGYENEMMIRRINKAVPDKVRQAAITNWIEAGGDPQLLRARADATKDSILKRGYEDAINLSEKELDVAREAVAFYDKMLKEGQAAGILESALANYINHIWKKGSQTAQRLQGEVNAGLLNTNFSYARKRIWSTYFEGEQAGRLPKDKSVSFLMGKYFQAFHEAVAARQAIKSLTEGKTADGMPIVSAVGGGDPVPKMMPEESRAFEDVPPDYDMTGKPQGPDAYLIKPRKLTSEQAANYRYLDHPALRKWKWIGNDVDGTPMLMQGDLWVHKDHFKHLSNMLKKSAIREHWLGGPVMTAMGSLKGTLLAGSPFHAVHVGSHGLMHMVNITDLPELDFSKPLQREAVQHGLMVYNRRGLQEFGEGVASTGLVNKIPLIGDVSRVIGEYTFESFIPRLKMRLFEEAFERNMRRYSDKYSRDQILELTANQSNAAFGELNYKAMGRNPTMQDIFRILALAPDFLEARARFVGQALKPGGREQALALLRGSVALAGTAAIGSMLFGDKEHGEMGGWNWKEPFSLNIGKKKYTIRSVPGDLLHLVTNPRNFAFWRLNPSTVRPLIEMTYGRDVWGRRRSFPQQVGDYFSSHVPIPAQPLVPSLKRETSLIDGALRSIGVASYPFKTAADQAMMDYFMEARIDRPSSSEIEAVQQARRKVLKLAREGKEDEAVEIVRKTGEKYKLSPVKALDWLMEAQHPENVANFKRLPLEVMARVMNLAEPAEEQAFIPILLDKISNAKPDKLEMALPELERYMESVERKRKRQAPAAAAPAASAAPAPPAAEPPPRPFSILGGRR